MYEARPFSCRMFGHCTSMVCPHGYNRNVTHERELTLLSEYEAKGGSVARGRMLHEFAYTLDEIKALVEAAFTPT